MNKGIFTDSDERVPVIKIGTQLTASSYTALCYALMSQTDWFLLIEQSIGIYFCFGAFAGIYIFKAGLYFYDLLTSKNKNIGKVAAFMREFIATVLFTLAIVFGTFPGTILGALSSWLFVGSTLVGLLYHLSVSVYTGLCCKLSDDLPKKAIYKESCIRHLINSVFFMVGATLLSLFLFTQIAPVAFALANAGYNLFCFIFVATLTIHARRTKKIIPSVSEEKIHLIPQSFATDYYGVKNRENILRSEENEQNYLLEEIDKKIQTLTAEDKAQRTFFQERQKRQNKILSLNKLKNLIKDPVKSEHDFENLLKEPLFHTILHNPFQSFFRKTSDTWDIFLTARAYLKKRQPTAFQATVSFC